MQSRDSDPTHLIYFALEIKDIGFKICGIRISGFDQPYPDIQRSVYPALCEDIWPCAPPPPRRAQLSPGRASLQAYAGLPATQMSLHLQLLKNKNCLNTRKL